jgi:hypothetical protein
LKNTILKYSSLLALLGSTLISTQTYAAECATGTAPAEGCTIDVSNITYTLTGDIEPAAGTRGIEFTIDADSNTLNLTGDITTSGANGDGLFIDRSDSNTINMIGNIVNTAAVGEFQQAILLSISDSNTITLTGNIIRSNAGDAALILSDSDSNKITINGTTTKIGAAVAYSFTNSSNNNLTINGDISSLADGAHVFSLATTSTNNLITMTGDISTAGDGARAIWLQTGDATNNNTFVTTGNITTTGEGAVAIQIGSNNNTINHTGNITTTGEGASYAVWTNGGSGNNLNITGNIITSGTGGNAEPVLLENSDSNTFTLSGAVHSLGGDQAIGVDATSQNNTFTFKRGVSFIGGLENNGGTTNKLIFDMGKSASYNIDTDGTTWTLEDTSKPIVSGSAKSMGVADIDNQAHILYRRMDPVNDVLSERQRLYTEGQRPTGYYMDSYYGHDKRDEDYSEISGNAGGMTVGYVLENTNTPMEVLVNFEVSQDNYGSGLAKQTTETNSVMAGLFLPALAEDVLGGNISAKVLVSGSDNDAKRTVLNNTLGLTTASEKVSGDYNSGFISAGAEWLTEFLKVERVRHDISIGADLVQAYNEDYTAGEYKVDSRDMTQIQSRILYGMTYKNAKKTVDVNTRFGVSNQYMVSGDKQDYKINGTSVSYTGDDNSFYYTAGLGAKYYLADNTNFYVDTKYGQSSDDIQNMTIDFGFISRF